jgi:hypothetical protein
MQNKDTSFPKPSPRNSGRLSKHNLPPSFTPLIGREQTVVMACTLLRRPEVRLLTLTGTGGVGKTRLALQIATDLLEDFGDGVYFFDLASIADPELVLSAVAHELGIQEIGVSSFVEQIQVALQEKRVLLVLDNFEQVVVNALPSEQIWPSNMEHFPEC